MAKKSLGQNFLFDLSILHGVVESSLITDSDTVVEIGPGHGSLTSILAGIAKKVIAIELDHELYAKLQKRFSGYGNIILVHGDALSYPYETLEPFKVVANIPYYITTPIIFKLLEAGNRLISMTLTVQKEVARRIVSGPNTKDYGVLSLAIQYVAIPEMKFIVPREAFKPVPKVRLRGNPHDDAHCAEGQRERQKISFHRHKDRLCTAQKNPFKCPEAALSGNQGKTDRCRYRSPQKGGNPHNRGIRLTGRTSQVISI